MFKSLYRTAKGGGGGGGQRFLEECISSVNQVYLYHMPLYIWNSGTTQLLPRIVPARHVQTAFMEWKYFMENSVRGILEIDM